MTKEMSNNKLAKITEGEQEIKENEVRSNLRYCWQKAMSYAILYKGTIEEIMNQLVESFLSFIPKNHVNRENYRKIMIGSFQAILGKLYTTKNILDLSLENEFIEMAIVKLREILN